MSADTEALLATVRGGFPPGYAGKAIAALNSLAAELEEAQENIRQLGRDFEILADARQEQRAELERLRGLPRTATGWQNRAEAAEAELERVKAERDALTKALETPRQYDQLLSEVKAERDEAEETRDSNRAVITELTNYLRRDKARLNVALTALREIERRTGAASQSPGEVARAAIAEIEGE